MKKSRQEIINSYRTELKELIKQGNYSAALNIAIKRGVTKKPEHHYLITKTRARQQFKVTEKQLKELDYALFTNPHYKTAAYMQLYLLAEIEAKFPLRIKRTIVRKAPKITSTYDEFEIPKNIERKSIRSENRKSFICNCDNTGAAIWTKYDVKRHGEYMPIVLDSISTYENDIDVICCTRCGLIISESLTWLNRLENEAEHLRLSHTIEEYMRYMICPMCQKNVSFSRYLLREFSHSPQVCWIAHLITHCRHKHTDWDMVWSENRGTYWFDYEYEKYIYNERIKRDLICRYPAILMANGVEPLHFEALQNTNTKTVELAEKYLKSNVLI